MITEFKLFETKEEYEIGDYIKTNDFFNCNPFVKERIFSNTFRIIGKTNLNYGNVTKIYNFELQDRYGDIINLSDKSIERKLRKKEIEKFELEEVAIKYNL